ncbi:MAG: hypothetical protein AMJ95_06635 [Omnitrophica WOR_2 bacterium SM23_72]|nr:MAG: hypothetical protein AMJ95_06635 [Omnitrophica WOR_2 bacterium SM23_72]
MKFIEFLTISLLVLAFCTTFYSFARYACIQASPNADWWHAYSTLELQITRILGLNPGGLWDGGYIFPFHKVSILTTEPAWGVSLMLVPFWLVTRNIFFLVGMGNWVALVLSWMASYWFAKGLGCKRLYAFLAAMTFSLSNVSTALIQQRYFFWTFFLIPISGYLLIRLFQTRKIIWGVLFGLSYGYLGWCSSHLFFMGGVFLAAFALWQLWSEHYERTLLKSVLFSFAIAFFICSPVYISQILVHRALGRPSAITDQFHNATNGFNILTNSLYRPFNFLKNLNLKPFRKGEVEIGISFVMLLTGCFYFFKEVFFPLEIKKKEKSAASAFYYLAPGLLAGVNLLCLQHIKFLTGYDVDILWTAIFYLFLGWPLVFFRDRIMRALENKAFFFLSLGVFFATIAFGPYYLSPENKLIPSPVILLLVFVPGFSGIRAIARWGLLFSFSVSLGVALGLSGPKKSLAGKLIVSFVLLAAFLEMFPGINHDTLPPLKLYEWKPREVDIFLKQQPKEGAVLELETYPIKDLTNLGYELYSSLYHKRPILTGYGAVIPPVTIDHLYEVDGTLDAERVASLRKFGARYWVLHLDKWPKKEKFDPPEDFYGLRRVAEFNGGKTLVYEDSDPKIAVTLFGLIKEDVR